MAGSAERVGWLGRNLYRALLWMAELCLKSHARLCKIGSTQRMWRQQS